ncbi:hypothetical protein [Granulicella tundricola]|uniref:Stability/partitioning determinant n=1 Tax=Granulicella tundricola (strain ATCC BAA-1859 / DSM 23138 / MP5ACTX9) TaxID=1198114 RepID=E8X6T9_GRATM|nr:hypothetical protein [Granulicella tundricola]ADW71239.1 hypothetical protein AciX9_3963 [Granulicella tundricola MP5ACTX9]
MNKFGLLDEEDDAQPTQQTAQASLTDRLAAFPAVTPRPRVDLAAVDAAGAAHGFVSREASPYQPLQQGRRRRAIPSEPTRHLAIRLTASAYDRFVAYADLHKLTYHDALTRLMDESGVNPR